jgi:hypothetical protein
MMEILLKMEDTSKKPEFPGFRKIPCRHPEFPLLAKSNDIRPAGPPAMPQGLREVLGGEERRRMSVRLSLGGKRSLASLVFDTIVDFSLSLVVELVGLTGVSGEICGVHGPTDKAQTE